MKLIADELAVESAAVIDGLLRRGAPGPLNDQFFGTDYSRVWQSLLASQWQLTGVSQEAGGAGFDLVDLSLVGEVWGRHMVPLPFIPTLLLSRWFASVRETGLPFTYALPYGNGTDRSIAPFLTGATQLWANGKDDVGEASRSRPGAFANAQPPQEAPDNGWSPSLPLVSVAEAPTDLPAHALHEISVLGAAELVGAAESVLEVATTYAISREQFGQSIADYQAVQHRLADMRRNVEIARTAVVYAANEPDRTQGAVQFAWNGARLVSESAIQIHGGFGFTWESGLHYYSRHVWAWATVFRACGIRLWP